MVAPSKKSTSAVASVSSAIKPASFYGNSLPRPRFFTNPRFNTERVDPPVSVLDPLLSWANDAHWSMGGLNFKRLRLQGRIEGNVDKLRTQRESQNNNNTTDSPIPNKKKLGTKLKSRSETESESPSPSAPAAPVAMKRRRMLLDSSDQEDEETIKSSDDLKKGTARKLWAEFEKVAMESGGIVLKKSKKKNEVNGENSNKVGGKRTSPRLAKRRLM